MMLIKYRDIEEDLLEFPLSQIQLVAKGNEHGESLTLRVETTSRDPNLSQKIVETLLHKEKKIRENLENKNLVNSLRGLMSLTKRAKYATLPYCTLIVQNKISRFQKINIAVGHLRKT